MAGSNLPCGLDSHIELLNKVVQIKFKILPELGSET
jgi:hypothetical protein